MPISEPMVYRRRRHPCRPPRRSGRSTPGFTLVELLVGTVLGSLVLGAIGGALMTSELRLAQGFRRDTSRREGINRVVALMQSEANTSSGLDSRAIGINTANIGYDICSKYGPSLRVRTNGGFVICYKAVPIAADLATSYSATSGTNKEKPWSGSCLLIREGPPYDWNGDIYLKSNLAFRQVLLDDLQPINGSCSGAFSYTLTAPAAAATPDAMSSAATITIRQSGNVVTTFSLRAGSNRATYGIERCNYYPTPCESATIRHIRLLFPQVMEQPIDPLADHKTNLYYFPFARASYQVTSCTYALCTLSSNGATITLKRVNALIFADLEIRP